MTPFDRAAVLRDADSFARQGQLDRAIAEYLRVVENRPRDWSALNALGDLYVRAGRMDDAIEQFGRIADGVASEGFTSRAIAFYRKILKLVPDHERAQRRVTELQAEKESGEASVPLKPVSRATTPNAAERVTSSAPEAAAAPPAEAASAPEAVPAQERRVPLTGSTIDEVFAQLRDEAQREPELRDAESRIDEMINSRTRG